MAFCNKCGRRFPDNAVRYLFTKKIMRFVEVCPKCFESARLGKIKVRR
jgi:hypothetical protein